MYKIAIIGSRNFSDKELFTSVIKSVFEDIGIPYKVISGGADGTDTLAHDWAIENNIEVEVFFPKHKDFPKKTRRWMAPKDRNTTIVENSDVVLSFWDMKSTGTKDTIEKAIIKKCPIYVYNLEEKNVISNIDRIKELLSILDEM